ncbi:hypothetical protein [Saccharomonospora sp. CUA-673]|uniref:hypothetical protein n=1 Tax=Saccharomonospora sp. CUA-673 TaxID=1904969 RepID=UPI0013017C81|nr:hypothetical protein [Saccharomonospora sp. CUA-673]
MSIPYAGLHQLLRPVAADVANLTDTDTDTDPGIDTAAHADTLRRVLAGRDPGERFAVGVALLELLSRLAAGRPVLVLVDDLQWMDAASTDALLFVSRRLAGERVGILVAATDSQPAGGIPQLRLSGVDDAAATRILEETDLPPHRRASVIAASWGIPAALREIGTDGPVDAGPFAAALDALPGAARTVLLVAAVDDTCDTDAILAAAGKLGAGIDDLRVAEDAGLVAFTDGCFGFSHPLIGPAVYRAAPFTRRLEAHRALVDVLSAETDADRRARHLAASTTTPDESVAAELEDGVDQARMRGGMSAVADAYERAARLSPAPRDEGRRLTSAARAAADAGQPERARHLADQASALLPDPEDATWSAIVRAELAQDDNRPIDAHHTLVAAAKRLAGGAPGSAGKLLFAAVETAWSAGEFDRAGEAADLAEALGVAHVGRVRLLDTAVRGGPREAVEALRELLDVDCAAVGQCADLELNLRVRTRRASWWALLGRYDTARAEAFDLVAEARTHAAGGVLPGALTVLARAQLHLATSTALSRPRRRRWPPRRPSGSAAASPRRPGCWRWSPDCAATAGASPTTPPTPARSTPSTPPRCSTWVRGGRARRSNGWRAPSTPASSACSGCPTSSRPWPGTGTPPRSVATSPRKRLRTSWPGRMRPTVAGCGR